MIPSNQTRNLAILTSLTTTSTDTRPLMWTGNKKQSKATKLTMFKSYVWPVQGSNHRQTVSSLTNLKTVQLIYRSIVNFFSVFFFFRCLSFVVSESKSRGLCECDLRVLPPVSFPKVRVTRAWVIKAPGQSESLLLLKVVDILMLRQMFTMEITTLTAPTIPLE